MATFTQNTPYILDSAESWTGQSSSGEEYLIQIGYPRDWVEYQPRPVESRCVPVLYLTDGNAVFLSALDALHRLLSMRPTTFNDGVIVAIGYPLAPSSRSIMSHRRARDLTPKCPGCEENEGGADDFMDFIQHRVKMLVRSRLEERYNVKVGKEALYGHSYGGLFSLYTLFTRPHMFDCYIASSPSVWWNKEFILEKESEFRQRFLPARPSLMLSVGGDEQQPPRRRGQTDKDYQESLKRHLERKMVDHLVNMHARLKETGVLQHLSVRVYPGEDHGTVIGASLSRSLVTFFDDWPLSS